MDKGHKIVLACCATMALMLVSCASDELLGEAADTGRAIAFEVGVAGSIDVATTRSSADDFLPTSSLELHGGDSTFYANCDERNTIDMHYNTTSATTRGSIQTNSAFYDSFGLYGYVYDSSSSWTENKTSLSPDGKINKLKVSKADGTWTANAYWPGSTKRATFFAYAPYGDTNASISTTGTPSVTYTVPQTISEQQDLLIAKSAEDILCDGNTLPSLSFDHALTAVKFQQGTLPEGYTIKSIEISGVYNKGKLSFDGTIWENHKIVSGTNTYSASLSDVLFLMPQTIPSGAKLKVTFTDGSKDYPLEADLYGTVWKKGYKYTYSLSANEIKGQYELEIIPTKTSIDTNGETISFTVKSKYTYDDGSGVKYLPWTVSYQEVSDNEIIKETSFVTSCTTSSPENLSSEESEGTITISKLEQCIPISSNNNLHTAVLKQANEITTTHDLSNGGETANCYVINAPGYYSIPIVYGNARNSQGANNSKSIGSDTKFQHFVNSDGVQITTAYLVDMGQTPADAVIVWQDAFHLISPESLSISDDKRTLFFRVSSKYICQGNALIAVRDNNGTILWSWHIWVTDYNINETVEVINRSNTHYNFMHIPLGYCDEDVREATRKVILKVKQSHSNIEASKELSQSVYFSLGVNAPTYQYGRKDPQCPSNGIDNGWKTMYDTNCIRQSIQSAISTSTSIKEPYNYYYVLDSDWNTIHYFDLWDVGNTKTDVQYDKSTAQSTKSIYDPSPMGYKVPEPKFASRFSLTGGYTTSPTEFNITGTFDKGWNIYAQEDLNGITSFWHALGCLQVYSMDPTRLGLYVESGISGRYWTCGPNGDPDGYVFGFSQGSMNGYSLRRAHALPVRSCAE